MKLQLEQLDLLSPWPVFVLRPGYHAVVILVRIGVIPIGEVMARPVRHRVVTHRRLRRRIARKHAHAIVRALAREALAAGPNALLNGAAHDPLRLTAQPDKLRAYVCDVILNPQGLPAPYQEWSRRAHATTPYAYPPVTVVVCTRDRVEQLHGCIQSLRQLDYPQFQILICDNSRDPRPTRTLCDRMGVGYVREPLPGLSRARNTALNEAPTRWVAFTDDDCRPEKNWLKQLVRPVQNTDCACVCGLIVPAQLENSAEITFEIYGGLGRGCTERHFDREWLNTSLTKPPQTWRIGAGANMLIDRDEVLRVGGFNTDLGPGGVGGCGEDTLVFYQLIRRGRTIHYTPRALVHHYHRSSDPALRKHIASYAIGHAAYHWHILWRYADLRSGCQLFYHLPRWFLRSLRRGVRGQGRYPVSLVLVEARGTFVGPIQYTFAKLASWMRGLLSGRALRQPEPRPAPQAALVLRPIEPHREQHHAEQSRPKRMRVA